MKRIFILLLVCIPVIACGQKKKIKKANEDTEKWRYEIENISVGANGTNVIKVWSYSKLPSVAKEQSKKNAIHGVVFKGIPGSKFDKYGKRPLVEGAAVDANAAFFKSFFSDGGDYMRYVSLTTDGFVGSGDVLKVDKKEYKVGVVVNVNYNELRRYLESKDIVKKLGSGF